MIKTCIKKQINSDIDIYLKLKDQKTVFLIQNNKLNSQFDT